MAPMPPQIRTTATVKAMLMRESPSARAVRSVQDERASRPGVLKHLYPEQASNLVLPAIRQSEAQPEAEEDAARQPAQAVREFWSAYQPVSQAPGEVAEHAE